MFNLYFHLNKLHIEYICYTSHRKLHWQSTGTSKATLGTGWLLLDARNKAPGIPTSRCWQWCVVSLHTVIKIAMTCQAITKLVAIWYWHVYWYLESCFVLAILNHWMLKTKLCSFIWWINNHSLYQSFPKLMGIYNISSVLDVYVDTLNTSFVEKKYNFDL